MKLGICSWVLPCKEIDCFKIANKFGINGLVIDYGSVEDGSPFSLPENRDRYMEESKKYSVEIPTMALNLFCDKGMTKKENYNWSTETFDTAIEIASLMNISKLQVPSFYNSLVRTDEDLDNAIAVFKYACKKAEEKGIIIGSESILTIEQHTKLINEVNSKQLVTLFDTQNPWQMLNQDGLKLAEYYEPYTYELHAKDSDPSLSGDILLGDGNVKFNSIIEVFRKANFNKWVILESPYSEMKQYEDILKLDILKLKDIFS